MTDREDTIAAIATAPGNGGIGIIRLSGPKAESILMKIFHPAGIPGEKMESHRMVYGRLSDGEETLDECMAVLMRAPKAIPGKTWRKSSCTEETMWSTAP